MKVDVSNLKNEELLTLMQNEGITWGFLKTNGPITWLEYY